MVNKNEIKYQQRSLANAANTTCLAVCRYELRAALKHVSNDRNVRGTFDHTGAGSHHHRLHFLTTGHSAPLVSSGHQLQQTRTYTVTQKAYLVILP